LIAFFLEIPKLAMHVFGLLACCTTLREMDEVLSSSSVLFCSPCSGPNVAKHYRHLQLLLQQRRTFDLDEKNIIAEDYKVLNVNIRGKKSVHGLTFVMHLVYCIIKTNQTRSDELNSTHMHQNIHISIQVRQAEHLKSNFCGNEITYSYTEILPTQQ